MSDISVSLEIAWDGVNWVHEETRFISANGSFNFSPPTSYLASGGGTVDTATIVLANASGAYNTYVNNASFLQRMVKLEVNTGAGLTRIFSGAINAITIESPTPSNASVATLQCVTQEGPVLQNKYSMRIEDFYAFYTNYVTESDLLIHLLSKARVPLFQVIDSGTMLIPWAWTDDESILDECWSIAAACGGVLYTNRLGHIVYKNASTLAKEAAISVETLSRTAGSFGNASLDVRQDDLYSEVVVSVDYRAVSAAQIVWSPDEGENITVPPAGTRKITATFDDPVVRISSVEYQVTTYAGAPMDSSIGVARVDYAQKSEFTFTNSHATDTAFIKYIRIVAFPVVGGQSVDYTATVPPADSFWVTRDKRTRSIRDNVYIQSAAQAQYLADILLEDSKFPRRQIIANNIPGKTTRFIGDVVTVQDSTVLTTDIKGRIERMSWSLAETYLQSITVRDFGQMYQYAEDPGYFIVGTDVFNGTKRMFF